MIQARNLTFRYAGSDEEALSGLDFSIDKGEIFGFLGPSGAGKSTCQGVLYKILRNFEGDIKVEDKDINSWGRDYFEKIGVGFELPNHYGKLTAAENLALFASFFTKGKCRPVPELLAMVGLEGDSDKPVDSFSKGMKMRLNFVRAIMHDPDILFFDEPTSGLDPGNAHIIKDHIRDLRKAGKTIFITTHDMMTADELCDRVSFIVDGRIVTTDEPSKLKLAHGKNVVKVELKDGSSKEFPLSGLGSNQNFIHYLQQADVLRVHTQEATLEQVFIDITGQKLIE